MQHKEGNFKGLNDYNIYYQRWLPDEKPVGILLVSHGFAEHSGRYGNLVNHFVPQGYAVYALDHRGHGRSDGERVKINDFHDCVVDLKTFFNIVRTENPKGKIFLIGHSMGSFISLLYTCEYQQELAGLVTSGGGLARPGNQSFTQDSGKKLPTDMLSRDPNVIKAYEDDPLVYHGPIPVDLPMFDTMKKLYVLVAQIRLPVLIMAGNGVQDGERSRVLYEHIGSEDKTLKIYEGLKHEIFNEPEHPAVFADLETWLKAH